MAKLNKDDRKPLMQATALYAIKTLYSDVVLKGASIGPSTNTMIKQITGKAEEIISSIGSKILSSQGIEARNAFMGAMRGVADSIKSVCYAFSEAMSSEEIAELVSHLQNLHSRENTLFVENFDEVKSRVKIWEVVYVNSKNESKITRKPNTKDYCIDVVRDRYAELEGLNENIRWLSDAKDCFEIIWHDGQKTKCIIKENSFGALKPKDL